VVWNKYGHFTRDRRPVHNDVALNQCHCWFNSCSSNFITPKGTRCPPTTPIHIRTKRPRLIDLFERQSREISSAGGRQAAGNRRYSSANITFRNTKYLFVCITRVNDVEIKAMLNNYFKRKRMSLQLSFPPQNLLVSSLHTYKLADFLLSGLSIYSA
jgi:hypothetical protein